MISAQTRSAFVARENRYPLFPDHALAQIRIMTGCLPTSPKMLATAFLKLSLSVRGQ